MSDQEFSISELRKKRDESQGKPFRNDAEPREGDPREEARWANSRKWSRFERARPAVTYIPVDDDADRPITLPFDPVRLLDALKRTWMWWFGIGLLILVAGLLWTFLSTRATVSVQLMRIEVPVLFRASETGDPFRPQELTQQTLLDLMRSPDVIRRVLVQADPPVTGRFMSELEITPERESDLVTVTLTGNRSPQEAVDLLNLYASSFVEFTRDIQTNEAQRLQQYLKERLAVVEREMSALALEVNKVPAERRFTDPDRQTEALLVQLSDLELRNETARIDSATLAFRIDAFQSEIATRNPARDHLQIEREELSRLLARYTDAHPAVQQQRAAIAALEQQLTNAPANPAGTRPSGPAGNSFNLEIASLEAERQALALFTEQYEELRGRLTQKLESLSENSMEYTLLRSRHDSLNMLRTMLSSRIHEAELFMDNALGHYQVFTPATLDRVSMRSHWNKRLTLSFAGAFFAMLALAGLILFVEVIDDRLKTTTDMERATDMPVLATLGDLNKMSEKERAAWAFRTWTILKGKLGESQNQGSVCGFISARHGEGRSTWVRMLIKTANERGLRVLTISTRHTNEAAVHPHERSESTEVSTTLSPNVFSFPAQVAQKLNDPNAHSVVHIPIPGWAWNLERRQQWQVALNHWRRIDNLVLLVELPPVTEPEAILLAEKIPQLIWLTESGKTTFKETRMHLETLRHAGCNLVGTVLNREPVSFWRNQFSRFFPLLALFLGLGATSMMAQETPLETTEPEPPPPKPRFSFSANDPSHRAEWQKRLTLGPGDVLNLAFFGETNLTRTGVIVGPDGRINYLQAQDIVAAGLTVDELREALDTELGQFYRSPRTMVVPVAYNSKRYYVLGRVMNRGVFALDRPMTVVEALARAQGVETGMLNRDSVDLADLQRSFLIRRGERVPINFEKLFQEGDLSQNILIEPDDYLYFPPAQLREVYVVGEVRHPGVLAYTQRATAIAAISHRGGFTERAYKRRVLVVRGSINEPETFIVDLVAILEGREPDFQLEPRDIIYASHRPFIRVEELLDLATRAFIQSAVTTWAGANVGPILTRPLVR